MTNDEFYTPKRVYEVIKNWAVKRYGLEGKEIIRPFYKGGDYKRVNYPKGCVVIDNPPFSIGSQIVDFYLEKGAGRAKEKATNRAFLYRLESCKRVNPAKL